ncbi:GNAT family N-acetyltransferase [Mesorhizobium sp. RP14(2022)]|uniref:GNAT family N-acetyltransferase n=1 Tax=Mesorhizobium liriopis TaxID=2953882 RepID=A0ABT1CBM2_9HYPH|nr:GNAT family protein [Mesorhizobium liriopis]MCO6052237.1 GNAT family N-acetyltransferase [Mesorhizobium liriopis]
MTFSRPTLRALQVSDSISLSNWLANPKLAAAMNIAPQQYTPDAMARYILSFDERVRVARAVVSGSSQAIIGILTVTIDERHKLAVYNLMVAEPGEAKEAVIITATMAAFDWLFDEMRVEKIATRISAHREGLAALMEKLGMRREGVLKGEVLSTDGTTRLDQLAHGLLAVDWPQIRSGTVEELKRMGF